MPAKTTKPKIKVEEIEEEKEFTIKEPEKTPKISSFSQLDSMKPTTETSEEPMPTLEPSLPAKEPAQGESQPEKPAEGASAPVPQEKMSSDDVKDWLKDIRPDTTKDVEKGGGFNFKVFLFFLVIFALLGALVGGIFYYKQNVTMDKPEGGSSTTAKETPTPEPTKAPQADLDLTKYAVSVMNGSGIKGEAGKVKDLLVKGGFSTDKVSTGNASTYDHKTTSVSLKKDVPEGVFDKVKEALGSGYDVEKAVATLSESSTSDVEIVVGNSK